MAHVVVMFIVTNVFYPHVMYSAEIALKQRICNCRLIRRTKSKQLLGAAVLSKTSASSVTGGTSGKYVQSHVDGEIGCSTDAVQQQ